MNHLIIQILAMSMFYFPSGGNPSRSNVAMINIEVIDINNNVPVFSQPEYEASIAENRLAESFVHKVNI
jgi:hypothetical protein